MKLWLGDSAAGIQSTSRLPKNQICLVCNFLLAKIQRISGTQDQEKCRLMCSAIPYHNGRHLPVSQTLQTQQGHLKLCRRIPRLDKSATACLLHSQSSRKQLSDTVELPQALPTLVGSIDRSNVDFPARLMALCVIECKHGGRVSWGVMGEGTCSNGTHPPCQSPCKAQL